MKLERFDSDYIFTQILKFAPKNEFIMSKDKDNQFLFEYLTFMHMYRSKPNRGSQMPMTYLIQLTKNRGHHLSVDDVQIRKSAIEYITNLQNKHDFVFMHGGVITATYCGDDETINSLNERMDTFLKSMKKVHQTPILQRMKNFCDEYDQMFKLLMYCCTGLTAIATMIMALLGIIDHLR